MKFARKQYDITHLNLGMSLHYLGKLKIHILCRYSADMKGNANKLHFSCTDFNSSMSVSVYAERFYVFLSNSCYRRWIPWQALQCRLLWRISGVTNWSQTKRVKNSDTENFICIQYGEKLVILNTENIKICGWITKLETIKMQCVCMFFHVCWISTENLIFYFPR